MKLKHLTIALGAVLASCATPSAENGYTLTTTVDPEQNGARAYIVDYDTGESVDSTDVTDGTISFAGTVDRPVMARLIIGGNRGPMFILEPGDIVISPETGDATGTPLNTALNDIVAGQQAIISEYNTLADDSIGMARQQAIRDSYASFTDSAMTANLDNPVGYYLFIQQAYDMSLPELESIVAKHPALGDSRRVGKLRESLRLKDETSEGKMFKDFEVTDGEVTARLSDYVGKGHHTLVDFWASWCGPCIRETATIKELYNRFGSEGLEVLGVAVWDEPENTRAAIERHSLPWPQIINARTIPTDIYGISSIPTIILFDPEGRIVSRGKQGAALVADVEAAMAGSAQITDTK